MLNTHFFKCLICGCTDVNVLEGAWECRGCGKKYPKVEEIPLLVRDGEKHQEKLRDLRMANPGWYEIEQPPEAASPWRHHLRKRRLYVETAITKYLWRTGKSSVNTLLDMGCGEGNNLDYLRKYCEMLVGSDYNLLRLLRVQSREVEGVTLFLGDILDYPVKDDFFEIIFFNHVIEHIPSDTSALETAFRVLRPKGLLILGAPNEGAGWWRMAYKLQPWTLSTTDHVHFYDAATLRDKLTRCGFEVLEVKYIGWGVPHWGIDARVRKYKIGDDAFEAIGRAFFPRQASSLYLLATKEEKKQ